MSAMCWHVSETWPTHVRDMADTCPTRVTQCFGCSPALPDTAISGPDGPMGQSMNFRFKITPLF